MPSAVLSRVSWPAPVGGRTRQGCSTGDGGPRRRLTGTAGQCRTGSEGSFEAHVAGVGLATAVMNGGAVVEVQEQALADLRADACLGQDAGSVGIARIDEDRQRRVVGEARGDAAGRVADQLLVSDLAVERGEGCVRRYRVIGDRRRSEGFAIVPVRIMRGSVAILSRGRPIPTAAAGVRSGTAGG